MMLDQPLRATLPRPYRLRPAGTVEHLAHAAFSATNEPKTRTTQFAPLSTF